MAGTDKNFKVDYENRVVAVWKIPSFSKYNQVGEQLASPSFSTSSTGFFDKWYIVCWPNGNRSENSGYISIGVFCSIKHYSSYDIGILSSNTSVGKNYSYCENKQFNGLNLNEISRAGDRNIIANSHKTTYLPQDTLTISLKVNVNFNTEIKLVKIQERLIFEISEDFGRLFETKDFSDISLIVKSKKIAAHKCILSRIPYFKAMFTSGMKEIAENIIIIEDIDEDVMEEIIKFIYTGKSPKLKELADRLVVAADRLDIENLKELCELQLLENLSPENFCSLFLLADQLVLHQLKSACLIFSANKMNEIIKSQGFDEIMMANPQLIKVLFQEYVTLHS